MAFKVDIFSEGEENEYDIIIISNEYLKLSILCDHRDYEYNLLYKAMYAGSDYEMSTDGKDSHTAIYFKAGKLTFESYTVVCGRDMKTELTFNKEEGTKIIQEIINLIAEINEERQK